MVVNYNRKNLNGKVNLEMSLTIYDYVPWEFTFKQNNEVTLWKPDKGEIENFSSFLHLESYLPPENLSS